jgi:hypothetical protein
MNRKMVFVILALASFVSLVVAGGIKEGSLQAFSNGSGIVVRWISDEEQDVRGYTVERRAGAGGTFMQLTDPYIACKGNGSAYEFVDNTAFRVTDNFYVYRVTAMGNGKTYDVTVTHNISSVRRTWGSIKAMFR